MPIKHNLFLRYFPPPRFLRMPAVGFEVDDEAIRFVEIVQKSSGLEVKRFDEAFLSPGKEGESFLEGKRIAHNMEEFCAKNKIVLINSALPDEKAYIFKTEVPYTNDPQEIKSGVELRLEENVPIPPREAIFDFQVINDSDGKGEQDHVNVAVSVVPRLLVSKYLDFFKSFGLVPISLKISAQATADAVIKEGDSSGAIIVNFGVRKTSFHIVHSGVVHFTSSIDLGGNSLTQAISKSLSVSLAEAEQIKKEKGVVKDKKNADAFFSLVSLLSSVKDEINKLIEYWKSHKERYTENKTDVEKVILCGKEAALPGLVEYVEASLGVRVELANVWMNVASLDKYIPPISKEDSLSYATVIGLALAQYKNR